METPHTVCYRIRIEATRVERTVGGREWIKDGDPSEPEKYGYTPNVMVIKDIDRDILDMTVASLDVPALIQAALEHSSPLP